MQGGGFIIDQGVRGGVMRPIHGAGGSYLCLCVGLGCDRVIGI